MNLRRARIAAIALGVIAAPAAAESVRFAETGHYQLRIDGEKDDAARLYLSEGVPRLLVRSERLTAAWLIVSQEKTARSLPAASVACEGDEDRCDVDLAGEPAEGLPVTIQAGKLRFQGEGHVLLVEPRDPLLGLLTAADLLRELPEYRRGAAAYVPRRGDLRLLRTLHDPVEVEVFFGSWCPHCERFIPRLLAVLQQLDNDAIHVRFRGLPRRFGDDPVARQFGIEGTPTAVLRRGTREIGRITGAEWERPEAALSAVLFGGS